ncbi:MAG: [FeFe] hydrogenase H-cluster radical SAM maturase HydG [Azoarcus sp.]|jgi:2-iminoacetate synthase|nr:[FeFe] hydrogenase H-cluster radical SAM maturase HydG [Azoarcus sp.]
MNNPAYAPFLDEGKIRDIIENQGVPDTGRISDILKKAREGKGLDLAEVAVLLAPMPGESLEALYAEALAMKEKVYGKRMVLFAPLYISNLCVNSCAYCAFSATNKDLERKSLTDEEIIEEVKRIQTMGHKRVLAVYGEHPKWNAQAIVKSIETIYAVKTPPSGEIRRINVNCAPLDVDGFRLLKGADVGTYQCFQEPYHRKTYNARHFGGIKKDYDARLFTMHRAQEAGLDDVGLGVLFGLFDPRFEVLSLLQHSATLEKEYGAGPHTVSFPRIEPAQNSTLSDNPPYAVSDDMFKRIIAVVRLALPYTGMIITSREKPALKRELFRLGISQLSAGSRTSPGGYANADTNKPEAQQFWVGDERELPEMIHDLQEDGYLPSFCTSCYRKGRTGEHFMGFARNAFIHKFCQPNALLTYYEYLLDYGDDLALTEGRRCVWENLEAIPARARREALRRRLLRIENGQRDLCV